jgi:hypothetical protein
MDGAKIKTTIEALVLFLKSLPSECRFEIISFGDYFLPLSKKMSKDEKLPGIAYTDENVEKAILLVEKFAADMCGTEISKPLL